MSPAIFLGVDISQDTVDVAVQPGTAFKMANDEQGITAAVNRLQALQPTLIVLEATGGLEVPLVGALPPLACLSSSSIPGRCGTLPERRGSWRRPIGGTPRSSPTRPPGPR